MVTPNVRCDNRRMSPTGARRAIGYPTNRLLAVIDDPAEAAAALGRFATEELCLWHGPEPDIPGYLRC